MRVHEIKISKKLILAQKKTEEVCYKNCFQNKTEVKNSTFKTGRYKY